MNILHRQELRLRLIVRPKPESRKGVKLLLESWAEMLTNPEKARDSRTGSQVTDQLAFNNLLDLDLHPLRHHSVRHLAFLLSIPLSVRFCSLHSRALQSSAMMSSRL